MRVVGGGILLACLSLSKGGVQRGPAPFGGGLGVSPRILLTFLGWAGGSNQAHVAATTPTPLIARNAPQTKGCRIPLSTECALLLEMGVGFQEM
jgi:hypothetical protein